MKKNNVAKGLFAALLLACPLAGTAAPNQAEFKPEILYQDAEYIAKSRQHTYSAPAASTGQAKADIAGSKTEQPAGQAEGISQQYSLIGLVAFALVGFVFWSSRQSGASVQNMQSYSTEIPTGTTGETGVARYMKSLQVSSGATPAETGVARYLRSQETSATETAGETGVARYLKNIS